jgi:hypothetical protein
VPVKVKDFRNKPFDITSVNYSGKDIGKNTYWKLYAVENLFRLIVHSILTAQIGTDWWLKTVDKITQDYAEENRKKYTKKPWHGSPGSHPVYYITLGQLNEAIRANKNLFQPVITDIEQWIVRLELISLPRNLVCHMNLETENDRKKIDVVYEDTVSLVKKLNGEISILIP